MNRRELAGKLTICGVADLSRICGGEGVTHVLSILDPETPDPPALLNWPRDRRVLLHFHDVVEDGRFYRSPQPEHVEAIMAFGEKLWAAPDSEVGHLLVHCHMGISRSTAAMAILLSQSRAGAEMAAFNTLFRIRPRAWPNSRMVAIADRLLRRNGALTAALKAHQRRIITEHPEIGDLVIDVGREDELPR